MDLGAIDINREKKRMLYVVFVIFLAMGIHQYWLRNKIYREGVYQKCIVINREGYKRGVLTTVRYKFRGENYECIVHNGKGELGDLYFIMILPDRPESAVFLDKEPVPNCLLSVECPFDGWKALPKCR